MNFNYIPAMLLLDSYKLHHRDQYPEGTEKVYTTLTPRSSRLENVNEAVFFGLQKALIDITEFFDRNFFKKPLSEVIEEYQLIVGTQGFANPNNVEHIKDLHAYGRLPLTVKAIPEGLAVPLRVAPATFVNTDKRFAWLTNYLETIISCETWDGITAATIAREYRRTLNFWAKKTAGATTGVEFQGHDFSFRGMNTLGAALVSGLAHLTSFVGTDTVPAVPAAVKYYGADYKSELIGTSIPATEHSVMCANGQNELAVYKRLITEVYPNGPVSIVSDTWDFWGVIENVIRPLKDVIMARTGGPIPGLDRVVIRPDSGDPVLIMCGNPAASTEIERKGLVEALWDIFGGTVTSTGYKLLDSHIGSIYGDSITVARAKEISERLAAKGFASQNAVYGIGSYTYQYNTRDTLGMALKSTLCQVDGEQQFIQKNPKTDDGTKKSAKGAIAVVRQNDGAIVQVDGLTLEQADSYPGNLLSDLLVDGRFVRKEKFSDIRSRVLKSVE